MKGDRLKTITTLLDSIGKQEKHPLVLYRPWYMQEPFHRSRALESLVWGGKRSGKTLCVSMEFISRIFGRPIKTNDDTIPLKFPISTRENPRQYWVIGWNWPHAATIFKYLFEPGQGGTLRVIRDAHTNEWRVWNRAKPEDVEREHDSILAPPLITGDMIIGGYKGIAWEEPKKRQWQSVRLINGAVITYYPSNQLTAQPGEAVSGIWIDEDIQNPAHIAEWQDRLIDMGGWFMWSVWPQTRNNALLDLQDRADATAGNENPQIQSFQLDMTENPYIAEEAKRAALTRMGDDESIARRTRGDMMLNTLLMYEGFAPVLHCLRHANFDEKMQADKHPVRAKLTQILMQDGRFPRRWTRYLSMDPSFTRTAAHSWVVPPSEVDGVTMPNIVIVEWEFIALRRTADEIAQELHVLMAGLPYEAYVMDQQIGRQTGAGRDDTVFEHFGEAFRKKQLVSRQTLSGFLPGCNEPPTRFRTIRRMLTMQDTGMPMILFVEERNLATKREFTTYRRKVEEQRDGTRVVLDTPHNPRVHDCMSSVEYGGTLICGLMDQGIAYVEPVAGLHAPNPILARMEKIRERDARAGSGASAWDEIEGVVHLGPGRAA